MTTETCQTCRFMQQESPTKKTCRRYPPQTLQVGADDHLDISSMFPVVYSDEWCGEYQSGPTRKEKIVVNYP